MNDNISGWNDWTVAFEDWSDISISELQGLMTGIMTACEPPDEAGWNQVLEELSFAPLEGAALTLLTEEAEDTVFQLKDQDDAYAYMPLVPDDDHDLYERVIALKHWANGFMTGFGITDCRISAEENDLLATLSMIGGIRIEPDDEFEGGEESYLHLYEFARMVPVSLGVRKRKPVSELALISGLPVDAKTAKELEAEAQVAKTLPPIIDAMNQNNPS